MHADFRGNLVGRVPSRGEQDVFEQDPNGHDVNLTMNVDRTLPTKVAVGSPPGTMKAKALATVVRRSSGVWIFINVNDAI
jgi:hypothetical protein